MKKAKNATKAKTRLEAAIETTEDIPFQEKVLLEDMLTFMGMFGVI
jgi:hypothetical protein